mgnify:CR=1 FL=1
MNLLESLQQRITDFQFSIISHDFADLAFDADFYTKSIFFGVKRIKYQALVGIDEENKTVYLFEKAEEFGLKYSSCCTPNENFVSKSTMKQIVYFKRPDQSEIKMDVASIRKAIDDEVKKQGYKLVGVLNPKKILELKQK